MVVTLEGIAAGAGEETDCTGRGETVPWLLTHPEPNKNPTITLQTVKTQDTFMRQQLAASTAASFTPAIIGGRSGRKMPGGA
jgi:hypothetical protein